MPRRSWIIVATFLAGLCLGLALFRGDEDAQVEQWTDERDEYFQWMAKDADAKYERAMRLVGEEGRARAALAAQNAALARENARLKARRRPVDSLPPVPDTCATVVADLVEQVAIRDSIHDNDTARIANDSTIIASLDRQLAAMTNVAVIQQVARHEAEALLRRAPVRAEGTLRLTGAALVGLDGAESEARGGVKVKLRAPVWAHAEYVASESQRGVRLGASIDLKVF